MTKRGFQLDRIFLGLYYFLFAPTRIIPVFPFIMKDKLVTSYLGKTIFEDMHGGFYFLSAISILGLLIHLFKNQINNEKLLKIGTVANIMGILIVILDTELAGILPRYITDFAWLLNLSTIIVILSIIKKCDIKIEKTLVVFITLCLIINGFSFFLGRHLFENFPILKVIYAQIYYSFMFWL